MSPREFRDLLAKEEPRTIVQDYIFTGIPALYRGSPQLFLQLKNHLTAALGLHNHEIFVVGSGRFGYSLRPDQFGANFTHRSDVDVIIIDEALFNRIRKPILEWFYARYWDLSQMGDPERLWLKSRQREIFMGWIGPKGLSTTGLLYGERLAELDRIRLKWFQAFKKLDSVTGTKCIGFKGRLYQSRETAELYHAHSLTELKREITGQ